MILSHLVQFQFIKGATLSAVVPPEPTPEPAVVRGGGAVGGFPGPFRDRFAELDAQKQKDVDLVVAMVGSLE